MAAIALKFVAQIYVFYDYSVVSSQNLIIKVSIHLVLPLAESLTGQLDIYIYICRCFCFPTSMSCYHDVAVQLLKVMLYATITQQA